MSMSEYAFFPFFDGQSFGSWAYRMEQILNQNGVLNHIKQDLEELKSAHEIHDGDSWVEVKRKEEAVKALTQADKKCKNLIIQGLSDDVIETVTGSDTAYGLWKALESKYFNTTVIRRMALNRELHMLKYKPEQEGMQDFCLKFDKIVRDLIEAGEILDNERIIIKFLMSMPPEYEALTMGLRTLSCSELKMEYVRQKIQEFETMVKARKGREAQERPNMMRASTSNEGNRVVKRSLANKKSKIKRRKSGGKVKKQKAKVTRKAAQAAQAAIKKSAKKSGEEESLGFTLMAQPSEIVRVVESVESGGNMIRWKQDVEWALDSGSSYHLVQSKTVVFNFRKLGAPRKIFVAKNDIYLLARGMADVNVHSQLNKRNVQFVIRDCFVVDDLAHNLISVAKLEEKGYEILFKDGKCLVKKNGKIYAEGIRERNLYKIRGTIKASRYIAEEKMKQENEEEEQNKAPALEFNIRKIKVEPEETNDNQPEQQPNDNQPKQETNDNQPKQETNDNQPKQEANDNQPEQHVYKYQQEQQTYNYKREQQTDNSQERDKKCMRTRRVIGGHLQSKALKNIRKSIRMKIKPKYLNDYV